MRWSLNCDFRSITVPCEVQALLAEHFVIWIISLTEMFSEAWMRVTLDLHYSARAVRQEPWRWLHILAGGGNYLRRQVLGGRIWYHIITLTSHIHLTNVGRSIPFGALSENLTCCSLRLIPCTHGHRVIFIDLSAKILSNLLWLDMITTVETLLHILLTLVDI